MQISIDKYNGATIDSQSLPDTAQAFEQQLRALLPQLNGKKLLWIKLSQQQALFIPILTELGFDFHHCAENSLMLVKKLVSDPIIPNAKNYNVGVGAVVQDAGRILVIKDRFFPGYKLPGGHIDPDESIEQALVREVLEETGIKVTFEAIINIGHFQRGQFGEQHLYFICTAKNLTTDIHIYDDSEIIDAKWMEIDTFLNSEQVNPYNKAVVSAVIDNRHATLTKHPVKIKTQGEIFI